MQQNDQVEFFQSSINFTSFIHSYAQFLLNYFEGYPPPEASKKELIQSENQIIQSLVLIEKLHMQQFLYFSILQIHFFPNEFTNFFSPDAEIKEIFQKLNNLIDQHPFLIETNRSISKKTVAQILNYYHGSTDDETIRIIFTLSPLPPPWLANHSQIKQIKEV